MKRPKQFNWAVDTLVKAFFEGTLEHLNCKKCAIGNLVCAAIGHPSENWYYADVGRESGVQELKQIGYSLEEASRIEEAFELALPFLVAITTDENITDYTKSIEHQFNGLMAVLDVLFEIHEVSEDEMPAYRNKFKGHPELETA